MPAGSPRTKKRVCPAALNRRGLLSVCGGLERVVIVPNTVSDRWVSGGVGGVTWRDRPEEAAVAASGHDLGVFLFDLLTAAKNHLPEVSGQYRVATTSLDRTDDGLRTAFARPPELQGGFYGSAYEPWIALRDELSSLLAMTTHDVDSTAEALALATEVYSAGDDEAAGEFRRLLAERGEPRPGDGGVVLPPGAPGGAS